MINIVNAPPLAFEQIVVEELAHVKSKRQGRIAFACSVCLMMII